MTKDELIDQIKMAFATVKLLDGIGIWEAQAIDDYATVAERLEMKKKDERDDWSSIPYSEISYCESSLSFFDANGMRFCLPQYLICDILAEKLEAHDKDFYAPDVILTLTNNLNDDYQLERFSTFNNEQLLCVIKFLEFKMNQPENIIDETDRFKFIEAIENWKSKLI